MVYLDWGCLVSEKRGDALAQNTVIPQQIASPLEFMDTGQTPCWSTDASYPADIEKQKPFHQTF